MGEVAFVQDVAFKHAFKQRSCGIRIIERQRFHVAGIVAVGAKSLIAITLDPFPQVRILVVVEVVIAR